MDEGKAKKMRAASDPPLAARASRVFRPEPRPIPRTNRRRFAPFVEPRLAQIKEKQSRCQLSTEGENQATISLNLLAENILRSPACWMRAINPLGKRSEESRVGKE
jgi:hypothetical protein